MRGHVKVKPLLFLLKSRYLGNCQNTTQSKVWDGNDFANHHIIPVSNPPPLHSLQENPLVAILSFIQRVTMPSMLLTILSWVFWSPSWPPASLPEIPWLTIILLYCPYINRFKWNFNGVKIKDSLLSVYETWGEISGRPSFSKLLLTSC